MVLKNSLDQNRLIFKICCMLIQLSFVNYFDRLKLKMIPCLICVKVKVTMQKLALLVLCTLLLD